MKNYFHDLRKKYQKYSFSQKIKEGLKIILILLMLILLKIPILLLKNITLDLVYTIFASDLASKIFSWTFEILYYLLVLLIIKRIIIKKA